MNARRLASVLAIIPLLAAPPVFARGGHGGGHGGGHAAHGHAAGGHHATGTGGGSAHGTARVASGNGRGAVARVHLNPTAFHGWDGTYKGQGFLGWTGGAWVSYDAPWLVFPEYPGWVWIAPEPPPDDSDQCQPDDDQDAPDDDNQGYWIQAD